MQKKIEQYLKLLKRMQGQALAWLEETDTPTEENLILDIDENLSRASWRCQQLLKIYKETT